MGVPTFAKSFSRNASTSPSCLRCEPRPSLPCRYTPLGLLASVALELAQPMRESAPKYTPCVRRRWRHGVSRRPASRSGLPPREKSEGRGTYGEGREAVDRTRPTSARVPYLPTRAPTAPTRKVSSRGVVRARGHQERGASSHCALSLTAARESFHPTKWWHASLAVRAIARWHRVRAEGSSKRRSRRGEILTSSDAGARQHLSMWASALCGTVPFR